MLKLLRQKLCEVFKRSERCDSGKNEEINQGLKCENLSEEINLRD